VELDQRYRARGVDAPLVYPALQPIQIQRRHIFGESIPELACPPHVFSPDVHVLKPARTLDDALRSLPALEPHRRSLAVLALPLVSSSGRLALARRRTSAAADLLLVRAGVVGDAREDRGVARLEACRLEACGRERALHEGRSDGEAGEEDGLYRRDHGGDGRPREGGLL
jgi:hypothetical protein